MAAKKKASKPTSGRRRPFTGLLAKPMTPPAPPINFMIQRDVELWIDRRNEYLAAARGKRIDALLARYGIDASDEGRPTADVLFELVMALVDDLGIPGFRIASDILGDKPKRGRPKKWNFSEEARLLYEVAAARARNPRRSEHDACKSLAGPGQPYSGYDRNSLYRIYLRTKKARPAFVRTAELVAQGRSDEIQVVGFRPTIKVAD